MWTKEELKLFDEFRELKPCEITLKHIVLMRKFSIGFSGRISAVDTQKLFDVVECLLKNKDS